KLAPGAVSAAALAPDAVPSAWLLAGNAGTNPATQFLGTTDAQPLELRVNGQRALRLEPLGPPVLRYGTAPNLLGGLALNAVTPGVVGATIAGGGSSAGNCGGAIGIPCPNRVTDHFGAIGGGAGNQAGDDAGTATDDGGWATVGGGFFNKASGSFA